METWFRRTLFATGVVNLLGALTFVPANTLGRSLVSLPEAPSLYLWILSVWIAGFGLGYLWLAITEREEWLFIAIAAWGKLSFAGLLIARWVVGGSSIQGITAGLWDLVVFALFVVWLVQHRPCTNSGGVGSGS